MKVKWENYLGEKFEGKIVAKQCTMLYIKLDDGSMRMVDEENVTIIGDNVKENS